MEKKSILKDGKVVGEMVKKDGKWVAVTESNKEFWRLPNRVIENELYAAKQNFDALYSTLDHGNDFQPNNFKDLIKSLEKILASAKKFEVGDEVPVDMRK